MLCYSLNMSVHKKANLKIFNGREDMSNFFE